MNRETTIETIALSDLTEEKRAECYGMWAKTQGGREVVILHAAEDTHPGAGFTHVLSEPGKSRQSRNDAIFPMFEAPRAINVDGSRPGPTSMT